MPNVHLTKPMQDYAEAQIRSGAYANLSEVVRAGMRTLMETDRARTFFVGGDSRRVVHLSGLTDEEAEQLTQALRLSIDND
jgi:Arc/MetJ-type ribon-helix-helix transcriptional regulator